MIDIKKIKNEKKYLELLSGISSLSGLFSDTSTPYINYRIAENIFCNVFNAENLSRSDIAYDAKIDNLGIGIKTFINHKNSKLEKIAEFNALSSELRKHKAEILIRKLAEYRNERISFANRTYEITNGIYHCVTRTIKKVVIYNTSYDYINIDKLRLIKETKAGVSFKDNLNEYAFNYSKSTLFKKFILPEDTVELNVKILDDPFNILLELLNLQNVNINRNLGEAGTNYIILPLYSLGLSKPENKVVGEKSGLNQWHAGGRKRDPGEVYIPVPALIHNNFPNFFPKRDVEFTLITPTNEKLKASICQDNSKALMTDPNKALADWLLRKLLKLKEGELLTYEKLKEIGTDCVIIKKLNNEKYEIDFGPLDGFDQFVNININN
jgi:hypothetical protein